MLCLRGCEQRDAISREKRREGDRIKWVCTCEGGNVLQIGRGPILEKDGYGFLEERINLGSRNDAMRDAQQKCPYIGLTTRPSQRRRLTSRDSGGKSGECDLRLRERDADEGRSEDKNVCELHFGGVYLAPSR